MRGIYFIVFFFVFIFIDLIGFIFLEGNTYSTIKMIYLLINAILFPSLIITLFELYKSESGNFNVLLFKTFIVYPVFVISVIAPTFICSLLIIVLFIDGGSHFLIGSSLIISLPLFLKLFAKISLYLDEKLDFTLWADEKMFKLNNMIIVESIYTESIGERRNTSISPDLHKLNNEEIFLQEVLNKKRKINDLKSKIRAQDDIQQMNNEIDEELKNRTKYKD